MNVNVLNSEMCYFIKTAVCTYAISMVSSTRMNNFTPNCMHTHTVSKQYICAKVLKFNGEISTKCLQIYNRSKISFSNLTQL